MLLENKFDFYILSWYKKHHMNQLDLNFLLAIGATNASAVLSLMLGWANNFVFLCDSDEESKAAMCMYQDKLSIILRVLEYPKDWLTFLPRWIQSC